MGPLGMAVAARGFYTGGMSGTKSARGWMAGLLLLALPAGECLGQTVRVLLTLPAERDQDFQEKASAAREEILALLAPGVLSSVLRLPEAKGSRRERWEFSAESWTPLLSAEERLGRMREMASLWGEDLRFEEMRETGLPPEGTVPSLGRRIDAGKTAEALLAGLPPSLFDGSGAAFDGSVPGAAPAESALLLSQYERAYRQGSPKPQVSPVKPPAHPDLRQAKEEAARKAEELRESLVRSKDPVARYRKIVDLAAAKHGVDPDLVEAVLRAEDPSGDPMLVSDAGAIGLMQIMPETARQLGIDPRNPVQNINGGVRHLKWLLKKYGGNKVLAVAAYNAGDGNVRGRIPNFAETKAYVRTVFRYYEELTGDKVDYASYMPVRRASAARRV